MAKKLASVLFLQLSLILGKQRCHGDFGTLMRFGIPGAKSPEILLIRIRRYGTYIHIYIYPRRNGIYPRHDALYLYTVTVSIQLTLL